MLREVELRYEVQCVALAPMLGFPCGESWRSAGMIAMNCGADGAGLFRDRESAEACAAKLRGYPSELPIETFINEVEIPPTNEE